MGIFWPTGMPIVLHSNRLSSSSCGNLHVSSSRDLRSRTYNHAEVSGPVGLLLRNFILTVTLSFNIPTLIICRLDNGTTGCPLEKNTLTTQMKKISEKAQLSRNYTNHSIRATSITVLANAGIDSTSITHLSGHKNVESLKPYIAGPSEEKCHQMSGILPPNEWHSTPNVYWSYTSCK